MKYLSTLNIVRRQQKVFTASLNEECGQQVKNIFQKMKSKGKKKNTRGELLK